MVVAGSKSRNAGYASCICLQYFEIMSFTCRFCFKVLSNKQGRERHEATFHSARLKELKRLPQDNCLSAEEFMSVMPSNAGNAFVCRICGALLKKRSALQHFTGKHAVPKSVVATWQVVKDGHFISNGRSSKCKLGRRYEGTKFCKPDYDDDDYDDDEARLIGELEPTIDMHNTGLDCTSHECDTDATDIDEPDDGPNTSILMSETVCECMEWIETHRSSRNGTKTSKYDGS